MPNLYQSEHTEIQEVFLEGIEEVFGTMFGYITLRRLDNETTTPNIYGESKGKTYLADVTLIAKPYLQSKDGTDAIQSEQVDAAFYVPTNQFIRASIPYTSEADLEILKKALILYDEIKYEIDGIVPTVPIAEKWHIYKFLCHRLVE